MRYYLPTGDWPLNERPFHNLMSFLGYELGDLENSDFLLLPGGSDIGVRTNRDEYEIMCYNLYRSKDLPIIGICRGMQLMLHLNGAELIQHIPDITQDLMHTTLTAHWTGESSWHITDLGFSTNSRHHQGFMSIPSDWEMIDKTKDGIIEAVKRDNEFGVQWHPELPEMRNTDALEWFVSQLEKTVK